MGKSFFYVLGRLSALARRRARPDLNRKLLARFATRRVPSWAQFKHIRRVLSPGERRVALGAGALAAVSAVWLVAVFAFAHISFVPARGGEYRESLVGSPTYLNPLYAPLNDVDADVVRLIYAGLTRRAADGSIEEDLAESLQISEDGKTYTARLADGRLFHDGKPVTADDVVFTVQAIKNPSYRSAVAGSFRGVEIEKVDDRTVRFSLQEPFAAMSQILAVGILPAHLWRDVPPSGATLAEWNVKPIGAGPFKFHSFVRDRLGNVRSYTLSRFEKTPAPAHIERVVFRFALSPETALAAFSGRSADGVAFVPGGALPGGRKRTQALPLRVPQQTAIFLNQRANGALADLVVRKALTLAVDRPKVMEAALPNGALLSNGPLPIDGIPGIEELPPPAFDPEGARALLEKAGWIIGADGAVREKVTRDRRGRVTASSTLALALTTVDREEHRRAAEVIAEAWRNVGIDVEVRFIPAKDIQKEVIKPRIYEALLYGIVFGADLDPFPFWHGSQAADPGANLANYTNRNADDLLVAARRTGDPALRAAKLNDFQKLIAAEAPAIFLYRPDYRYVLAAAVRGVLVDRIGTPADRFANITEWYMRRKPVWRWKK